MTAERRGGIPAPEDTVHWGGRRAVTPASTRLRPTAMCESGRVLETIGIPRRTVILFNVGLYGDRTYTRPGGLARGRAYPRGYSRHATTTAPARATHRRKLPLEIAPRRRRNSVKELGVFSTNRAGVL